MLRTIGIAAMLAATVARADPVGLSDFQIDRTEVTVGAFAAFADRSGLITRAEREGGGFEWGAGWERREGWTFRAPYGTPAVADEPTVHVSWDEARAYCQDAGGRLPTRSEWAAAAYIEHRAEPTDNFETGRTYSHKVGDDLDWLNTGRRGHLPWEPRGGASMGCMT